MHVCFLFVFFQNERSGSKNWACSVRMKGFRWPAAVRTKGDQFFPGKKEHDHPEDPGTVVHHQVSLK